jgi:hypothetical protein
MTPKLRTRLIVGAPIVAVATLMLGLRVGAGTAFQAAFVYAAPPGGEVNRETRFSWQIVTYLEDLGVRETIAAKKLHVIAETADGVSAQWNGESNEDGVAEAILTFPTRPDRVALVVSAFGEKEPLATGIVEVARLPKPAPVMMDYPLSSSKRAGSMGIDVWIDGGRLVVGSPTSVWVETHPAKIDLPSAETLGQREDLYWQAQPPPPAYELKATPEIGVRFDEKPVRRCKGYSELTATALGAAASTAFDVSVGDQKGTWFGTLPTAPGAFSIQVAPIIYTDETPLEKRGALLVAPNPRPVVYVEIDSEEGREYAAALPVKMDAKDPIPRALLDLPELHEGVHWIVASGDPRGAEKMTGATIAKGFTTTMRPKCEHCDTTCEVPLALAKRTPLTFPRVLAIDGIATRGARNRARHRQGLFIGLIALAAAALLEVLLLTAASREARAVLAAAEVEGVEQTTTKPPGGGLVVGLLVALLGFAFLAALMIAKA